MAVKVVLDTNIIIASLPSYSKYRSIIDKLINGNYQLVVNTEILLEYEEKLIAFYGNDTASFFIDALILLPNVIQQQPLFASELIVTDKDDNKFVDAYYSGRANILVTNDKHFDVLKKIDTPHHNIMDIDSFIHYLNDNDPPTAGESSFAMAA